jgi:hypothetical protein
VFRSKCVRLAGTTSRIAAAAVAAAAWLPACSGSSHAGAAPGGADAGASGSGSSGGTAGSSSSASASALDGYWKRQSATILVLNGGVPATLTPSSSFAIPSTTPFPDDGRDTDVVEQIDGDKLVTYAFITGNPGYFRVEQSLQRAGSVATLSIDQLPATEIFQSMDGQLVAQVTVTLGATQTIATTAFAKLDTFPPSGWPTLAVTLP